MCNLLVHATCSQLLLEKLNLRSNPGYEEGIPLCSLQCTRYKGAGKESSLLTERMAVLIAMTKPVLRSMCSNLQISCTYKDSDGKSKDVSKYDLARKLLEAEILPAGSGPTVAPRQTNSCLIRLINILFHDSIYREFIQSRTTCSRIELDNGETGAGRNIWGKIHEAFLNGLEEEFDVDQNWADVLHHEHSSDMFAGLDPSKS